MVEMPIAPLMTASLVAVAGLVWAAHIGFSPEPIAPTSAAAVAVGVVAFTAISVSGLLLVRAPWARRLGIATLSSAAIIGAATAFSPTAWVALASTLAAVGALSGPWLRVWLRRRPSVDGPGPEATGLALGAVAVVPLVGLAAPDGLSVALLVLAVIGGGLAWGYARARTWALWGLRLVLPAAAIAAAITAPPAGAVAVIAVVGTLTFISWTGPASAAIRGPTPPLPAPRPRSDSGASS